MHPAPISKRIHGSDSNRMCNGIGKICIAIRRNNTIILEFNDGFLFTSHRAAGFHFKKTGSRIFSSCPDKERHPMKT